MCDGCSPSGNSAKLSALHKPAHQRGGVRFHNGGKKRLLAGEIAIECAGGDTGLLHDLPQGAPWKPFSENSSMAACWIFSSVTVDFSSMCASI